MNYQAFIRGISLTGMFLLILSGAVSGAEQHTLRIHTSTSAYVDFNVELADTDAKRRRGLMFREHLPRNSGMLFDYGAPRQVAIWMKNTKIPLDILFINANGRIVNIHERAAAGSLDHILSNGRVLAVLELNAGTVDEFSISVDDVVEHRIFSRWFSFPANAHNSVSSISDCRIYTANGMSLLR